MAVQALFYESVTPLSNERHASYCIDTAAGFEFASRVNFVPLVCSEFEKAAWHYPIVFVTQAEGILPAAVLGFGAGENLFVERDEWDCEYVPAYVRRYPFILANLTELDTFTLCIDESFVGCNEENRGERLFLAGGGNTSYLERTLEFVRQLHGEFQTATDLCQRLSSHGLFEPMQAQVALNSGQKLSLGGFQTVSRERLAGLAASDLHALNVDGVLELLYQHLFSLANFGVLMDRRAAREETRQG